MLYCLILGNSKHYPYGKMMSSRVNSATTANSLSTSRKYNFYMKSKNSLSGNLPKTRPVSFTAKETVKSQNALTQNAEIEPSEGYLFDDEDERSEMYPPNLTDANIEKSSPESLTLRFEGDH